MSQTITAVYENGLLRPLSALNLPNKTRVTVQIRRAKKVDPVLEMMGMFNGDQPLIDDIAVSEDPDLYLVAEMMGTEADGLHAWEIAPARYQRGEFDEPVRCEG